MGPDDQAALLEGKRVTVIHSYRTGGGRKPIMLEDEHRVSKFRRYLPAQEGRKQALVQFFAQKGGLRTVAIDDIVDIS